MAALDSAFTTSDRLSEKPLRTLEDLEQKILSYYPNADLKIIQKAYHFSEQAHEGQIRRSGEPYISHPLSVAGILADLKLDLDSVATGLLHDTVEDTHATIETIRAEFGETIANLVDGVTKISKMQFKTSTERQGENIRKMIVAMGKDVRVILVKLADRLHNMRTLNHMPYEKQARIAQETLDIYCPLASRMGISSLKIELEDLAFRYLRPDMFYQLKQKVEKREKDQANYIEDVQKMIQQELEKSGHKNFEIQGRSKHLWSIYRKMQARNIDYEQVYDVLAFRVLVGTVTQCYEVLGLMHSLYKPIPGRFKDFIAMPKANNYQSLHTTVIGPGGERIEIQIRTKDMHLVAERGIAAHWRYKERGRQITEETADQFNWLKELVSLHQQVRNPDEFLDTVKTDLFESEIYVFTPKGEVREFPEGATPIDFAYAVHTELGNRCTGARVNGRMVPLKYQLQNGDSVEVVTSKTQSPSKDWLKFCVTNKAKTKIRAYVKEEQRKRSLNLGKELLEREFRKFGAPAAKYLKGELFEKFKKDHGIHDDDEVTVRVGYGKLEPRWLVEKLAPELLNQGAATADTGKEKPTFLQNVFKAATQKVKKTGSLIAVSGMDDVLVHYARCCSPIPGDPIVGFITRGRGITVHRSDCRKAFELDQMRRVDVDWTSPSADSGHERLVRVRVVSQDIPGLLKSMSEAFSTQGINIHNATVRTTRDRKAVATFEVSVKNTQQLNQVIFDLQKIKGIIGVSRLTDS
jgi:guanosine-3',5'-bis(diphosphate) 3'-pyrophosphohydrolase